MRSLIAEEAEMTQRGLGLGAGPVENLLDLVASLSHGDLAHHPRQPDLRVELLAAPGHQGGYEISGCRRQSDRRVDEEIDSLIQGTLGVSHGPRLLTAGVERSEPADEGPQNAQSG